MWKGSLRPVLQEGPVALSLSFEAVQSPKCKEKVRCIYLFSPDRVGDSTDIGNQHLWSCGLQRFRRKFCHSMKTTILNRYNLYWRIRKGQIPRNLDLYVVPWWTEAKKEVIIFTLIRNILGFACKVIYKVNRKIIRKLPIFEHNIKKKGVMTDTDTHSCAGFLYIPARE